MSKYMRLTNICHYQQESKKENLGRRICTNQLTYWSQYDYPYIKDGMTPFCGEIWSATI